MWKPVLISMVLAAFASGALAEDEVDLFGLTAAPQKYVGRHLKVDGMACALGATDKVACVRRIGHRLLRVNGKRLSSSTPSKVATVFQRSCKGSLWAGGPACRFAIEFTASGSDAPGLLLASEVVLVSATQ